MKICRKRVTVQAIIWHRRYPLDIKTIIDLNMLQRIQDRFSDATGLAAIAVDAEGNYITKGSNFTDFCMKYTRGCEEGSHTFGKNDTGVCGYACRYCKPAG